MRRGRPKNRDPIAHCVELLRERPERRVHLEKDDVAPAARVDTDMVGDVGVTKPNDEPQDGVVVPRNALGVHLHHVAHAGEDLADLGGGLVLLREVPHDDMGESR